MDQAVTPATFVAIYERHARDVYRYALALSGNVTQAEDLTAEAFLRVWQAGSRVELLTVRAYLVAIVRNLHRSSWRVEKLRAALPSEITAPADDPAVHVDLERALNALAHLDASDRDVLLLRAEGGLAYEEIAVLTGATANAVRVRAHRARKRLMEVLCPTKK